MTPNPPEQQREATGYSPAEQAFWDYQTALLRFHEMLEHVPDDMDSPEHTTAIKALYRVKAEVYPAFVAAVRAAMDEPQRAENVPACECCDPKSGRMLGRCSKCGNPLPVSKQPGTYVCLPCGGWTAPPAPPQQRDEAGESKPKCPDCGVPMLPDGDGWVCDNQHCGSPASPSPATDAGWRSKCVVQAISENRWTVHVGQRADARWLIPGGVWVEYDRWFPMEGKLAWFPSESAARSALASAPPPPGAEPARSSVTEAKPCGDAIVEGVVTDLRARSRVGQAKYGVMLTRTDLSDAEWLDHLYTEMLDAVNYLAVIRRRRAESQIAAALAQPPNSGDAKK